jgi:cysteinyl-tRNA synthetase
MLDAFEAAMGADLNVPMALGIVFSAIRKLNPQLVQGKVSRSDAARLLDALEKVHSVLAVLDLDPGTIKAADAELDALVRTRDQARERKDYEAADRIRGELERRGVTLEDFPEGTLYRFEGKGGKLVRALDRQGADDRS